MTSRLRRLSLLILLPFVPLCMATGCDDEDKIVVESPEDPNDPPLIATFGPQAPSGVFTQVSHYPEGVPLYIVGGDPDGLSDLNLAVLSVDTIQLDRFIARPDTSTDGCIHFSYTDTIPSAAILPTPLALPNIQFHAMERGEGGLFQSDPLGAYLGFPRFVDLSPTLDDWGGCSTSQAMVAGPYFANPPAVPIRKAVVITYVELEFRGVKVTLYDKVGATAVANYPDFRIVFTTPEELTALP